MNSTLDRLKALNEKLDRKLTGKKGEQKPKISEVETATVPNRSETVKSKSVPKRTKSAKKTDGSRSEELAGSLISALGFSAREEPVRAENLHRLAELYLKLEIDKKAPEFDKILIYKAMNISGIGLKEEDFGEIREGKYVQIIAITYEPDKNGKKKAKNISLGYYGKAEALDPSRKNEVIEFVLRWRYEKAFENLEHYRSLLGRIQPSDRLF